MGSRLIIGFFAIFNGQLRLSELKSGASAQKGLSTTSSTIRIISTVGTSLRTRKKTAGRVLASWAKSLTQRAR